MTVATTSLFAYQTAVLPRLGEKQREVLAVFEENPYRNWTNRELKEHLGWEINCITGRVNELVKAQQIMEKEKRFCTVTGMRVKAWGLADRLF